MKNPGRFLLSLALVMALIACVLTGCAGKNDVRLDPKNPQTLVIWHYYLGAQKTAFDDAVKEFNDTVGYEQGIIVEAINHGGVDELAANVIAAARGELDAGDMPNIFGSYGDTALEVLNLGMAANIDPYLSEAELAEYEEAFIREGRIGTDKLYVFPIAKSTESLMMNKTDFDAFCEGLKSSGWTETVSYEDLATWEGILRVADIYYRYTEAKEETGKALMGLDSPANYLIIGSKQLGQDLVKVEQGEVTINLDRQIMSKLWFTYYEPMVTGRFAKLGRFSSDDVKTGDSLCYIGSSASASYFPTELTLPDGSIKNIEMLALPMPVFAEGDKVAISQGAGMVISKSIPEKEYAAAIFLKWFTEAPRNIGFSLGSSYLPVKKEALTEELLNPAFAAISSDETGKQNAIKTLKVGIEQLRGYTIYFSDVFEGSLDFRNTLPLALSEAVAADRVTYLDSLQNGVSPEEAYAALAAGCEEKITVWLSTLEKLI